MIPTLLRRFLTAVLAVACVGARGEDWPGWRGPLGLGVSAETSVPWQWTKEQHIAWALPIPGRGASSPVVVGEDVYLTTQTEDSGLHVLAIDRRQGQVRWEREVGRGKLHANGLHNMATPTPASDGQRVWALFGTGDLACLDRDGKILWHRNLVKDYGDYRNNHGMGTSPLLFQGTLFIACMQQGPSYLLVVEAASGKTLWKQDRNLEPKDEAQDSYSSPLMFLAPDGPQVVLSGAEVIDAYAPATGDRLWYCGGLRVPHPYGRTIAGPAAGEGVVIVVASGFQNQGCMAGLRPVGRGDQAVGHKLWTQKKYSPDCPTPVVYRGKVFTIRDDGIASCVDLKTGEPDWQERLFTENVKVSPVAADGRVYFLSGQGNCVVVSATNKLELLATNRLDEPTLAMPAVSGGRVFLRTQEHFYCVAAPGSERRVVSGQ